MSTTSWREHERAHDCLLGAPLCHRSQEAEIGGASVNSWRSSSLPLSLSMSISSCTAVAAHGSFKQISATLLGAMHYAAHCKFGESGLADTDQASQRCRRKTN